MATDLEIIQEMARRDSPGVRVSTTFVGGKLVPQGAVIEMGVTAELFQEVAADVVPGLGRYRLMLFVIDMEEFNWVRSEMSSPPD